MPSQAVRAAHRQENMVQHEPTTRMTIAEVEAFALHILRESGLADHQAGPIARAMTTAEAAECHSHGLYRLIGYVGSIRSGRLIDLEIPRMYDAAFAYSGSSAGVRQRMPQRHRAAQ